MPEGHHSRLGVQTARFRSCGSRLRNAAARPRSNRRLLYVRIKKPAPMSLDCSKCPAVESVPGRVGACMGIPCECLSPQFSRISRMVLQSTKSPSCTMASHGNRSKRSWILLITASKHAQLVNNAHPIFDQGTPVAIRRAFPGHTVRTANERGWSALLICLVNAQAGQVRNCIEVEVGSY